MFTITSKHPRIREDLLNEFLEQDGLEVVFNCAGGRKQRSSRLVLTYHSKFFADQLAMAARDRANEPLVFNYPFSSDCVKTLLYHLHGLPVENVTVPTMVELLKFIKYEGKDRMDGMMETLLNDLCEMVDNAKLSIETKLMICLVCKSIKDFESGFDEPFFGDCTFDELKLKCFDIDLTSKENIQLKELLESVDDNGEPVQLDDYTIHGMILEMAKEMSDVATKTLEKMPLYDVDLEATIIKNTMSDDMTKQAIELTRTSWSKHSDKFNVASELKDAFDKAYGDGSWHCTIGCRGYKFSADRIDLFIRFNIEENQNPDATISLFRTK